MNFPLYIAQRYLKSKSGNNIINIVTVLACLGVMAATIAFFIVLSAFSGIKDFSLNIINTNVPDIQISPKKGKTFILDTPVEKILEQSPTTFVYSKVLEERAFFKNENKEAIAYIKGVDSLFNQVTAIDSLIVIGEWFSPKSTNSCITDYKLARELDLNIYTDKILSYVPKVGKGYITNPKNAFKHVQPQIVGVISNQNQDENQYVYVPLSLSQRLLGKKRNEISYLNIKVKHLNLLDTTLDYLKARLPNYQIKKREELNSSFYKILNSERLIAYLVSVLIIMMVLSNTSGTIIMVIVDKKKDIKTLLNMGATLKKVRQIFALYGFLLNLLGMLLGLVIGGIIVYSQVTYGFIKIQATIPYPMAFEWKNVWFVGLNIIVFGGLASLLASSKISKKYLK